MAAKRCPVVRSECWEHGCHWYIQVQGRMPQSGETVSRWGCAIEWLPTLVIDNSKEVRQGAAATESFRNEMVKISRQSGSPVRLLPRGDA